MQKLRMFLVYFPVTKTSRVGYNANTTAYSALMLTESKYIASVQSIIKGTAHEVADIY